MSNKADEIKLDIEELNTLLEKASRQKSKDILTLEIRKLQTELAKVNQESKDASVKPSNASISTANKCYEIKLNNYGWDQTSDTFKLYVTLKDVHLIPKENVTCNFTENSLNLRVRELQSKNYHLPINNLCEDINIEKSNFKIKTDMIVISLAKNSCKSWSGVTGIEKKIKEAKAFSASDAGDDSDPGANLMNLMKKMYQDGDDEMKKTIAKAWTESQEKQNAGL